MSCLICHDTTMVCLMKMQTCWLEAGTAGVTHNMNSVIKCYDLSHLQNVAVNVFSDHSARQLQLLFLEMNVFCF